MSWTRLCLLVVVCAQCRAQTINVLTGKDVTLDAVFTGDPDEITWTLNSNKIVEFNKGDLPYIYPHWTSRVGGDLSGLLTITNLSLADSGTYRAEVIIRGEIQPTEHSLRVYDHVCMPNITIHKEENNVTLDCTCSTSDATYEWLNGSRVMSKEQTLTVVRHPGDKEENVTCVVRNLVSSNNQTVTLQVVPVDGGSSVGLIVGLILLFVIAVVAAVLGWRHRERIRQALNCMEDGKQAPQHNQGQLEAKNHVEDDKEAQKTLLSPGNAGGINGDKVPEHGQEDNTNNTDL